MQTSPYSPAFIKRCATAYCAVVLLCAPLPLHGDERRGVRIDTGATANLFELWPDVVKAPKSQIATIELLVRPDADAIDRPASFLFILSNLRGTDIAGISLGMYQGVVRSNVLGVKLNAAAKLPVDEWSHVALTINTQTVNKQARLWINGKPIAKSLVLEYWPKSFQVAEMFSDRWNQGRVFTGHIGDVRVSRTVRYVKPFEPPVRLARDRNTVLLLNASDFRLSE